MPKLVCRACGKSVYTTAPFEQLFADERRCPRCGQLLFSDRRTGDSRRRGQRRLNGQAEPEPEAEPPGEPSAEPAAGEPRIERRVGDRRQTKRRQDDQNPFQRGEAGWVE